MQSRNSILLIILLFPFFAHADALDGLAFLYNLYGALGVIVGIIGLVILSIARHRRILVGVWAAICVLIGFPILDLIGDWGLEDAFIGPLFCFLVGLVLAVSLFVDNNKDRAEKEPGEKELEA